MVVRKKRHRGGQPGNRNAVKHGLYSVSLSYQEICEFWNAINLGGSVPELVILRIKLSSALQYHPGNGRILREASRMLGRWCRSNHDLDNEDYAEFKKVVRSILKALGGVQGTFCRNGSASIEAEKPAIICRNESILDPKISPEIAETDRNWKNNINTILALNKK